MSLSVLARLGFEEPEAAAADLERLAWGRRPPPRREPAAGRHRRQRRTPAGGQALAAIAATHPDPAGFTALLRRRLGFRRRLVPLVAASRSLGAWLATHPTEADRLAGGRRFAAPRPRAELVAAEAVAVVAAADPAAAWDGLRRFKRRELLRVAVRDLAGQVAVEETAAELAELADACLEAALAVAASESGYDPPPMRLAVLGGRQARRDRAQLRVRHRRALLPRAGRRGRAGAAARAAERVARGVMRGLSAVTSEGTCFEVDANLRPEGRNGRCRGPLAATSPTGTAGPSRGSCRR